MDDAVVAEVNAAVEAVESAVIDAEAPERFCVRQSDEHVVGGVVAGLEFVVTVIAELEFQYLQRKEKKIDYCKELENVPHISNKQNAFTM